MPIYKKKQNAFRRSKILPVIFQVKIVIVPSVMILRIENVKRKKLKRPRERHKKQLRKLRMKKKLKNKNL
jgi:hypothetical protein